jgi:hypothetical protein
MERKEVLELRYLAQMEIEDSTELNGISRYSGQLEKAPNKIPF